MSQSQPMIKTLDIDSFLTPDNEVFIKELMQQFLDNPSSVSAEWQSFFASLQENRQDVVRDIMGASWAKQTKAVVGAGNEAPKAKSSPTQSVDATLLQTALKTAKLIEAYRARGHYQANLDPLSLQTPPSHPSLSLENYGLTPSDAIPPSSDIAGETVGAVHQKLKEIYSQTVGFEYQHIDNIAERNWLVDKIEHTFWKSDCTAETHKKLLNTLSLAEGFEKFLHTKFTGAKRFGLDGGEAIIAGLRALIEESCARYDMQHIIFGMAHRGRLNVLHNLLDKPAAAVLAEFQGNFFHPDGTDYSGDVKYHLGYSSDQTFAGKHIHISLMPNPSHLEAVNPVVMGQVRAKQALLNDATRQHVLGILIHGDAAFAGQGIVTECLGMSQLDGYTIGGVLHVIVNNQVGFTTNPCDSRSSAYASDPAKMIQAPIFHVNGDDVAQVARVLSLALEYRQTFGKDVVVDFVCYRRFGHNETDEPAFTQPHMYQVITTQPSTRKRYADQLIAQGIVTADEPQILVKKINDDLQKALITSETFQHSDQVWLKGRWKDLNHAIQSSKIATGVDDKTLQKVGGAITRLPDGFVVHPKLTRFIGGRVDMMAGTHPIDWSMGEALAFGTLALENVNIRLSGQDCGRGTFTQRHAALTDQNTGERYVALSQMAPDQGRVEILDSPLSEVSVLGYELGYSWADPQTLVLWEAQFGDFANGAQMIVDQFLSAAESKWQRLSGLVMLLPHGYEGQGPEHSSARLERYLQLCAQNNMQVASASTPANYFHMLRRQMHSDTRKPLILMTPKSLLRHKLAVSSLSDFDTGSTVQEIIPNKLGAGKPKRVVFCTGKVYYDLFQKREELGLNDVALVRIEQLYPFPTAQLKVLIKSYGDAELLWCQEEPANMGAWLYIDHAFDTLLKEMGYPVSRLYYTGRTEAASPAVGTLYRHQKEQDALVLQALTTNISGH